MNKDNAIKPECFYVFYKKRHIYQTSDEYKLSCLLLVAEKPVHLHAVLYHLYFNLTVDVRKYLLKEKEKLLLISSINISERQCPTSIKGSARRKVRDVGDYCLAKLRFNYNAIQHYNCYKTCEQSQSCYAEAKCKMAFLVGSKQLGHHLKESTDDPESLIDGIFGWIEAVGTSSQRVNR
ncbi:hypothetical protein ACJMK2_008232 [Sinanodonta woodiana]|uniref:Uncharacterized protein n=1 Tax=Sinanodonta woodiana TaxID=1069815 RepID=A0ABD3VKY4_SINWO